MSADTIIAIVLVLAIAITAVVILNFTLLR